MIRIEKVSKFYGTRAVIDQVSFHFPVNERITLFGPNGAGKTTLLNILSGLENFDDGQVIVPRNTRIGFLPQEANPDPIDNIIHECVMGGPGFIQTLAKNHHSALEKLSHEYSDFNFSQFETIDHDYRQVDGYTLEAKASAYLKGLGFDEARIQTRTADLSGGWRMRMELVKVFLNNPDFLILDEPTNHLDLPALVWVENWLSQFKGTLLFVSHDKSLLERLPTMVLHLERGKITPYVGNLTAFIEQKERDEEQRAAQAQTLAKKRESLELFVTRFGAKASKAAQAQSKMKMIARLKQMESNFTDEGDLASMGFELAEPIKSGRVVLKTKDFDIGYTVPLSRNINLEIERGQKVAVIGTNGIGKSTLLKSIVGQINHLRGTADLGYQVEAAYFSQDQVDTLKLEDTVLQNVIDSARDQGEREVRSLLGNLLFQGSDVFKKVKVLSGGEKARVGLACVLVKRANFLLLDEPTNHLDLSSCEILAQALANFSGSILFVSHDRNFIDSVATHVFAMLPDGRHGFFEGKLDDYERLALVAGFPNVLKPEEINTEKPANDSKLQKKQASHAKKSEKRIAALQTQIDSVNLQIISINQDLEKAGSDFMKAAKLSDNKDLLESELKILEEELIQIL